jgi:molecular chaperone DnaK
MLKEQGDKISGAEKSEVESALTEAKKALEGTDTDAMNSARDRLTAASHKLAEQMYKSAKPQSGAGPSAPAGEHGGDGAADKKKKDEGVIDAEYVDVDEKK